MDPRGGGVVSGPSQPQPIDPTARPPTHMPATRPVPSTGIFKGRQQGYARWSNGTRAALNAYFCRHRRELSASDCDDLKDMPIFEVVTGGWTDLRASGIDGATGPGKLKDLWGLVHIRAHQNQKKNSLCYENTTLSSPVPCATGLLRGTRFRHVTTPPSANWADAGEMGKLGEHKGNASQFPCATVTTGPESRWHSEWHVPLYHSVSGAYPL